jgi:hypothetical protein
LLPFKKIIKKEKRELSSAACMAKIERFFGEEVTCTQFSSPWNGKYLVWKL